jgi:ADP-dependent NAD(P)H-hydrate dehydratase / NAD(P)H-hydrate epimerase
MAGLLTCAEMRKIEADAIARGAATGLALMERAGRGVAEAAFAAWPGVGPGVGPGRAVVLCAPGNNGGDGFVVARRLSDRGWTVEVLMLGDGGRMSPDARRMRELWGGEVRGLNEGGAEPAELVVDALFGTGFRGDLPGEAVAALSAARARGGRVVAVDCPSGLDCDTGRAGPGVLRADLTVTFHAPKVGHHLGSGPGLCGRLVVVDIGVAGEGAVRLVEREGDWPARVVRPGGGHKYARGHALVIAGGTGRGGAARMAARAALRTGAGLVTLGCPPGALRENAGRCDAVMVRAFREITDLIEFLADDRISAVCLGPGLGRGHRAQEQITAVLAAERATVIDADALTTHEGAPEGLFYQLHDRCVLTPHEGEFARLFPDLGQKVREVSKVEAVRQAAARAGCTVLLKGPDTVIAGPGGAVSLHSAAYGREAPWLGTAGAGDVLAGMIAGLLARTSRAEEVQDAVEAAAWLHVEAARAFGPGLIAEDLPEALPGVFRELGL